jgi:hypothetical protein
MKVHNEIKIDNLNIEQARNGFVINYWANSSSFREIFSDWKEVIKFLQNVELD